MISGHSPSTFRYFEVLLLEAKLCCCMFLEAVERGISNVGNPDEPQRARTKVKFMLLKNGSVTCIDIIAENFTQANSSSSEPGRKLFFSHEILATPDHISCVTTGQQFCVPSFCPLSWAIAPPVSSSQLQNF